MRSSLSAAPEEAAPRSEFLAVRAAGQDFALNIMSVHEIRGWTASTSLPATPAYVRGMINLRGAVLAIVDLAARLDLPSCDPKASSVIVVVEVDRTLMGLLVDEVCDIIMVSGDMMQAAPRIGSLASIPMVESVITLENRIVGVITLDALAGDAHVRAAVAA